MNRMASLSSGPHLASVGSPPYDLESIDYICRDVKCVARLIDEDAVMFIVTVVIVANL